MLHNALSSFDKINLPTRLDCQAPPCIKCWIRHCNDAGSEVIAHAIAWIGTSLF